MSFLIDRKGNIRFIAAGANDQEIAQLGKMIKKVVEERDDSSDATSRSGDDSQKASPTSHP